MVCTIEFCVQRNFSYLVASYTCGKTKPMVYKLLVLPIPSLPDSLLHCVQFVCLFSSESLRFFFSRELPDYLRMSFGGGVRWGGSAQGGYCPLVTEAHVAFIPQHLPSSVCYITELKAVDSAMQPFSQAPEQHRAR